MANPSEPLTLGYNYDDTQSLSVTLAKTIANSTLSLRLCEILQSDNSLCLLMAGSTLSTREVTSRLAVVTVSERQSPLSSTPDEVQPPIAKRKSSRLANSPIWTSDGQKIGFTNGQLVNLSPQPLDLICVFQVDQRASITIWMPRK